MRRGTPASSRARLCSASNARANPFGCDSTRCAATPPAAPKAMSGAHDAATIRAVHMVGILDRAAVNTD
jgi:hypothetical protein